MEEYKPIVHILSKRNSRVVNVNEDMGGKKASEKKAKIEEKLRNIEEAKYKARQIIIDSYDDKFKENAEDDIVTFAEIDMDDLDEESRKAEELKRKQTLVEQQQREKQLRELHQLEADSKNEIYRKGQLLRKQIERMEKESLKKVKLKEKQIKTSFKRTRRTLNGHLSRIKDEVSAKYKDLSVNHKEDINQLRTEGGFFSSQLWKHKPQVVTIRLELARCVKDKVPKGRYAILCSVLDRIGGNPTVYDSKETSNWRRVSLPKLHNGEHYLNNLRFEASVTLAAPSWSRATPSMVYLFELFLLKSREYAHDQVLGWGVFPLINAEFNLNVGKFKV
eukprot:TRINITY_DN1836_c0_g1_i8.p1 TRINITY_DN1836_c0_g1~~TRINITY_DN1836_c0_g1_i8.p1  ORF type:complete len:334 (-),score=121.58 TRINITY_DN1836_c0_g1_i8:1816-2817(-)